MPYEYLRPAFRNVHPQASIFVPSDYVRTTHKQQIAIESEAVKRRLSCIPISARWLNILDTTRNP